jgi:hypothetical protein
MKKLIYILLLLATVAARAQDETCTLSGIVRDEKGLAVPGATVFLTNTKYIAPTNINGRFSFAGLPPGGYKLVVKMISYATYVHEYTLQEGVTTASVNLQVDNTQLKTVTIKGDDPNRAKYMALFIKYFIGESTNARRCKITNPGIIAFHYDKNTGVLTAEAEKLLVIENQGLGYRLNYLLSNFAYDDKKKTFLFAGYPYFEELHGDVTQQLEWDKNRKVAYQGSVNHFFRAAFDHSAEAAGFYVFERRIRKYDTTTVYKPVLADSLFTTVDKNFKLMRPQYTNISRGDTAALFIDYRAEKAPLDFTESDLYIRPPTKLASGRDQLSRILPITSTVILGSNGALMPGNSFFVTGYWAWEKAAELMPMEYYTVVKQVPHNDDAVGEIVFRTQ